MFLEQIFGREAELRVGHLSDRQYRHIKTLLSLLFKTKFASAREFKIRLELFLTLLDESRESKM